MSNEAGRPLPFASVSIKGTGNGVAANADGDYQISVSPGRHTLLAQHIGYFSSEIEVVADKGNLTLNFTLPLQQYNLSNVTVTAKSENPAYHIIRNAIAKRSLYEHEVKKLQCDVYIKGRLQLQSFPDRVLGQKVNLLGLDSAQNQTLFLSETLARWSRSEPNKEKIEVLSTRVSGNSSGYGLSYPQIISFYSNNITIGENLNPRGFVSPIADNAFSFYDYRLDGTFYDNGIKVNHVRVIPKRKFEPVFSGYINIMADSWRIHSVQLRVDKDQQIQYLDGLTIDQMYERVDSVWLVKQQVISPSANIFGFSGYGNFVQVYSNFNLNPQFPDHFFNNIIIRYPDSATKQPVAYWDSIRPLPLQEEEKADYKRKDSLETIRRSPQYLDSVDRLNNKPKVLPLLLLGQTFTDTKTNRAYYFDPLVNTLSYNTVEGANIIFSPDVTKRWTEGRRSLFVSPTLRYGFSNQHFNAHLTTIYTYGKQYVSSLYVSGGKRIFQVNNNQPITAFSNATSTLLFGSNYMKIYEAPFGRVAFTKGLAGGLSLTAAAEYQDRHPLSNTTGWLLFENKGRTFGPNFPAQITDSNFNRHSAAIVSAGVALQPGSRYIEYPDRIVNTGSSYPTFTLTYTQGLHGVAGSDVDYSKWALSVKDDVDMNLAGRISYNITTGGFINKKQLFTPDYQHFNGNRNLVATDYLNSFQLARFYALSNTADFYTELHTEYHLNGFLTNKIPVLKRWNWFFVIGANALVWKDRQYAEYFLSIENILKIFRFDFVQSYNPQGGNTSGIRFSALGLLSNKKED